MRRTCVQLPDSALWSLTQATILSGSVKCVATNYSKKWVVLLTIAGVNNYHMQVYRSDLVLIKRMCGRQLSVISLSTDHACLSASVVGVAHKRRYNKCSYLHSTVTNIRIIGGVYNTVIAEFYVLIYLCNVFIGGIDIELSSCPSGCRPP